MSQAPNAPVHELLPKVVGLITSDIVCPQMLSDETGQLVLKVQSSQNIFIILVEGRADGNANWVTITTATDADITSGRGGFVPIDKLFPQMRFRISENANIGWVQAFLIE